MSEKPLETLDLNLLMALHWLLTERNVTAAAGRLGLSQPAASRALARLRLVFADPILVKSGSVMAPTRLGEKLQPKVAHSIETMRDVLRVSDIFTPEKQTGDFRVGCIDYVGAMLFDAWKQNITPVAPNLDLQMVELTIENGRDLVSGKIDLVFAARICHQRITGERRCRAIRRQRSVRGKIRLRFAQRSCFRKYQIKLEKICRPRPYFNQPARGQIRRCRPSSATT